MSQAWAGSYICPLSYQNGEDSPSPDDSIFDILCTTQAHDAQHMLTAITASAPAGMHSPAGLYFCPTPIPPSAKFGQILRYLQL